MIDFNAAILPRFQFHKGTIRTQTFAHAATVQGHFNSIKVQLELKIIIKVALYALFQFHKGTIRTHKTFMSHVNTLDFNSIKVQLELVVLLNF